MTSRKYRDPKSFQPPAGSELIHQVLIDHNALIKPFITAQSGNYTTTGNAAFEFVCCTGTGTRTISLHATPRDLDKVQVKRAGTGAVTVDTDGSETIDGASSFVIASQYDAPLMMYTDALGEWSLV